ncbi:hypothetical protein HGRIS_009868 [Hohenbuehelia grisea]|uniref:MYND-type domain-containing protein n=1 Tax=Hohenbuehelia grisea TaxID=104357 RepID=A0ABR3J2K1_9AGAR
MPIVDKELGVYIKDAKPDKYCNWRECPNHTYDEEINGKITMKKCAKCEFVRYCSKACQRKDWPSHKPMCRVYNLDISDWTAHHKETFKWAAKEALNAYSTTRSKTTTHLLIIDAIRSDFSGAMITPEPFVLLNADIMPFSNVADLGLPPGILDADAKKSREILSEGGLGMVVLVFRVHQRNLSSGITFKIQRHELYETPNDDYSHLQGWASFLRNTINHRLRADDLQVQSIEGAPSGTESTVDSHVQ